ncbi:Putative aldehyde dehydrogenase-like protein [Verticillium dahliae VDG1]|nr:Putative aldehyde dehydrogenase-like protein [Verticillium dahliae VDG1]
MAEKARSPAEEEQLSPTTHPRRSSRLRRDRNPSHTPRSSSTNQTTNLSGAESASLASTQATSEQSHRPQQGSVSGRRRRACADSVARPGHAVPIHLAMTPAADPRERRKPAVYVPAVPEEQIPSHIDFVNDPAHKFWTWSREKQGWFHEDQEAGKVIWAPTELD